ncbi:FHA domain-containing protein [Catellatospora sp. KI3]|uniref:FHA domain-containing protein n=1 Tax=Catellatospora sp. KI3 TaxID=3041620 RepID=UPI002482B840|nr:FHA domain-containing protein [Catellatospora sp. KI3]MDI1463440.1 FHA domain-containing protein [Catellatospora sp. KI3]
MSTLAAHLEMRGAGGASLIALAGDRITLGSADSNDIAVPADRLLSRLHAVFEHYPAGWCVRDLGSRNGTYVNGQRIWQEQVLADGDEIRAGASRFVLRSGRAPAGQVTEAGAPPPEITARERDVLVQLCRPLLAGEMFTEPASSREIAAALVVTEAAVKQHLLRLYEKFGIDGDGERRRVRLANEAMARSAITRADLR